MRAHGHTPTIRLAVVQHRRQHQHRTGRHSTAQHSAAQHRPALPSTRCPLGTCSTTTIYTRCLQVIARNKNLTLVKVSGNKIGPYGGKALAQALEHTNVKRMYMRGCFIGEEGAKDFAQYALQSPDTALRVLDLSVNGVGFMGTEYIRMALQSRAVMKLPPISVDDTGNLVFVEV